MLERARLAKMSFDMWGALSPTGSKPPPGSEEKTEPQSGADKEPSEGTTEKRTMSQAELESTLYKVCIYFSCKVQTNVL